MVRDHAMSDPATVARWKRIAPSIVDIPQVSLLLFFLYKKNCVRKRKANEKIDRDFDSNKACLMAFKRPVMAEFFGAWREAWNEWIYPTPFARLV